MSTISASTLITTALQYTADTTGALVFKTGATPTTALTLGADQSATFAGTVSFATASFTNLSYTGTFTGGTGVVAIGTSQFYKDASGNIGIGIAVPTDKFTLNAGNFGLIVSGGGASQYINFRNAGGSIIQQIQYSDADGSLNFGGTGGGAYPLKFSTNATERMRIDTNGQVAVGSSSPLLPGGSPSTRGEVSINGSTDSFVAFGIGGVIKGYVGQTSNGLQLDSEGATTITAVTNGSERMRIDSSGNVGIGLSSPTYKLDVAGVIRNSTSADASPYTQQRITVYNDGTNWGYLGYGVDALMRVVYSTTSTSAPLLFGTTSAANNTGTFTETMRISATSALVLKGGATSPGGVGVTFPATQSASSDANTLDDYEEGTWTPTLTTGATSYGFQIGRYVKVGRAVTITCSLNANRTASAATFSIDGLPFAAEGTSSNYVCVPIFPVLGFNRSTATSYVGQTAPGTSRITLYGVITATGANYLPMSMNDTGPTIEVELSVTYITA